MRCRIPWPSAVAYLMQTWDLELALIHATDKELLSAYQIIVYHVTLLFRSMNVSSGRPNINHVSCHREKTLLPTGTAELWHIIQVHNLLPQLP